MKMKTKMKWGNAISHRDIGKVCVTLTWRVRLQPFSPRDIGNRVVKRYSAWRKWLYNVDIWILFICWPMQRILRSAALSPWKKNEKKMEKIGRVCIPVTLLRLSAFFIGRRRTCFHATASVDFCCCCDFENFLLLFVFILNENAVNLSLILFCLWTAEVIQLKKEAWLQHLLG